MTPLLLHITTIPMSLTFLRGQTTFMREQGLRVHAVSSPGQDLDAFSAREGVPVDAVEMQRRITPLRDLLAIARLVRVMLRERPTIVHAHTPKGGLLGMVAAALYGAPVRIYHVRGLPLMAASGFRRILLSLAERVSCRLAHRVLCVSHSVRAELVGSGLCPPDKVIVLCGGSGNGVDSDGRFNPDRLDPGEGRAVRTHFGIPEGAPVIGYVGRIVRDKGIVELTDAWRALRHDFADLQMLLVGPFEAEDPVPLAIEEVLRTDERIHLAGMDWNTPRLYAAMDLVVLPTYREGFPNVPLEAAAMGLPVVATQVPGCVDAVRDGDTGLLVPARDSEALERAIRRYLASEELRRTHGSEARRWVREAFRQEAIWQALYSEYRRLLSVANITPDRESAPQSTALESPG